MNEKRNRIDELEGVTPAELDERLTRPDQANIARMVRALPEEPVSLVWRSELNERLVKARDRVRKNRRQIWIWRPALGVGLAAIIAVAVFLPRTNVQPPVSAAPSVEAALVRAHSRAVDDEDIAGIGLEPMDMEQDAGTHSSESGGSL